jgi:hypothetical protein
MEEDVEPKKAKETGGSKKQESEKAKEIFGAKGFTPHDKKIHTA